METNAAERCGGRLAGRYTLVAWFGRALAHRLQVESAGGSIGGKREQMSHSQYAELGSPARVGAVRTGSVTRPFGVTVVALFQALKAVTILLTALMIHYRPEMVLGSRSALYPILYLAMRGKSSLVSAALNGGGALLAVMLVFGAYLVYIAAGLWNMRPGARKALLFTSGMTLVLYLKATLISGAGDGSLSGVGFFALNLHNVHLLLFVDTAIFVYLMRGATASRFRAG